MRVSIFRITILGGVHLVEFADAIEHAAARCCVDACGVREMRNGVAGSAKVHALILRREKAIAPEAREEGLVGIDGA
jgi:hypothetical protein